MHWQILHPPDGSRRKTKTTLILHHFWKCNFGIWTYCPKHLCQHDQPLKWVRYWGSTLVETPHQQCTTCPQVLAQVVIIRLHDGQNFYFIWYVCYCFTPSLAQGEVPLWNLTRVKTQVWEVIFNAAADCFAVYIGIAVRDIKRNNKKPKRKGFISPKSSCSLMVVRIIICNWGFCAVRILCFFSFFSLPWRGKKERHRLLKTWVEM